MLKFLQNAPEKAPKYLHLLKMIIFINWLFSPYFNFVRPTILVVCGSF